MNPYLSNRISLIFVIFEFIINITVLAHPQRVTTPRGESDEAGCDKNFSCIPTRLCPQYREDRDLTIFPCKTSPELMVCCRLPASSTTTTSPRRNTTLGGRRTTTTRRPTTTTTTTTQVPVDDRLGDADIWASLSAELQEKAKLLPTTCGQEVTNNRILNGEVAELGQFPWMVLIGYEINGKKQFWCGGSLINKRYVLTAAHCSQVTTFKPTLARLGEWNVSSELDCQSNGPNRRPTCSNAVIDSQIEEIIVHERYGDRNLPSLQNDIALLRLAIDIEFTEYVLPICLTPVLQSDNSAYTVSGWGVSKPGSSQPNPILQFVQVYLYDVDECNGISPTEVRPLAKGQFCAGGADGKDACKGDSGGPLSYDLYGKYYQKGIVSLATSEICGTEGRPSIYTEVSQYMDWILRKIKP